MGGVQSFVRTAQSSPCWIFDRSLEFRWRYGNALSCFFFVIWEDRLRPTSLGYTGYALGAPAVSMTCMGAVGDMNTEMNTIKILITV